MFLEQRLHNGHYYNDDNCYVWTPDTGDDWTLLGYSVVKGMVDFSWHFSTSHEIKKVMLLVV